MSADVLSTVSDAGNKCGKGLAWPWLAAMETLVPVLVIACAAWGSFATRNLSGLAQLSLGEGTLATARGDNAQSRLGPTCGFREAHPATGEPICFGKLACADASCCCAITRPRLLSRPKKQFKPYLITLFGGRP